MNTPCNQPGVSDGDVRPAQTHALDLQATGFSLDNARELALYARMAYDEPPTVQDRASDTQVLVRDLGDCIVVAFRGTSSLRDFITDGQCWRTYTSFGEVHQGFYYAWDAVIRGLHDELFSLTGKPFFVCGHSLGGALAMLCAFSLRITNARVHSVYTFGCPRVGDQEFQRNYNAVLGDRTFTVINDCDIVPRMPGYLAGYRRPGHDEFIPEVGNVIVEDPSLLFCLGSDAISLAQGWWGKHSPVFLTELLLDHHIDNYINALQEVQS